MLDDKTHAQEATPRRRKRAMTDRHVKYARGLLATDKTKKQIALEAGYPPSMARLPASKIENTKGFHGAMAEIAQEANNFGLKVLHILQARPMEDEETKTLLMAVKVIGDAMDKFQPQKKEAAPDEGQNGLRVVLQQRIQNQTITVPAQPTEEANQTIIVE